MSEYKIINHAYENVTGNPIFDDIINLGFDDPLFFTRNINTGIHLQQNPEEFTQLVSFLISYFNKTPIKYLEVGAAAGGTCFVFNRYLNIENNIIIDINQHPKAKYRPQVLKDINHSEFIGNSMSDEAIKFAKDNGKYDLIFIDAGHQYNEIKNDIINYSPFLNKSGLIIFHDVIAVNDVRVAVNELMVNKWKLMFESKMGFGLNAYKHED